MLQNLYTNRLSRIHQLDARLKLLFTLAFILFLNLTLHQAWGSYLLFWSLIITLVLLSRLSPAVVMKRALICLPFVLAAFPLVFAGPPPRVPIFLPRGIMIHYSPEGLGRFISIAVKSWISVQAAVLLTATTDIPDLLTSLQQLKVPPVFTAIISLMWRYLFVIVDEVRRLLRARNSRSAAGCGKKHGGGSIFWRARTTGGMAGCLFLRSLERSDRVYAAMLSRGYTGELPASEAAALPRNQKWILLAGILGLSILSLYGFLTGG